MYCSITLFIYYYWFVEKNNLSSFQGKPGLELFPFANAIHEIQGLSLQSGQVRTLIVVIRSINENTEVGAGEEILFPREDRLLTEG